MKSVKLTLAVCVALCVLLSACGGGGSSTGTGKSKPPVTLTSISITPATATVVAGETKQFTATGKYSDNSTKDLTATATWTSSATNVATVEGGLLTGKVAGDVTISAKSGTVTGTVTVTVSAPALVSITVTPDDTSIALGLTTQFTAVGHYSNNTTSALTGVTWTSSDEAKVSMGANGLATTLAQGDVTITATLGAISDTAAFHVTSPVLNAMIVTTPTPSIAQGQYANFTAFAVWTDGSSRDVTADATWASSNNAIATGNGSTIHGVAQGAADISATYNTVSNSAQLTVTAATLQSIDITPDQPTINVGGEVQLIATGTFTDGTTQDLQNATWTSSASGFASVSAAGLVKGVAETAVPVTIEASIGNIKDAVLVTIDPALLVSVGVTPADSTIAAGTTQQFTATGTYSDGSTQDLSGVLWDSDNEAVATIGAATGVAKALTSGTTSISADSGTMSGSTSLTVSGAELANIIVTPAVPAVGVGATVQFIATGEYTDGTTQDLTALVTWVSSNGGIVRVDRTGNAAAISMGGATVTAMLGNIAGSTTMTVTQATIDSIDVLPNAPMMATRTKLQMRAIAKFSDGSTRQLTSGVIWSTSSGRTASVSGSGLVRSKKTGNAVIRATAGGKTGTESVTVTNATLSRIEIQPSATKIAAGTKARFTVTAYFTDGVTTQDLTNSVRWSTNNGNVATVASNGVVTSYHAGMVTVTATFNTFTTSATLEVSDATLVSLAITPATATEIALGTALDFTSEGTFSDGTTQNLTREVLWTSSNPQVAIMDIYGVAVSASRGTSDVVANFGAVSSAATTVTVK